MQRSGANLLGSATKQAQHVGTRNGRIRPTLRRLRCRPILPQTWAEFAKFRVSNLLSLPSPPLVSRSPAPASRGGHLVGEARVPRVGTHGCAKAKKCQCPASECLVNALSTPCRCLVNVLVRGVDRALALWKVRVWAFYLGLAGPQTCKPGLDNIGTALVVNALSMRCHCLVNALPLPCQRRCGALAGRCCLDTPMVRRCCPGFGKESTWSLTQCQGYRFSCRAHCLVNDFLGALIGRWRSDTTFDWRCRKVWQGVTNVWIYESAVVRRILSGSELATNPRTASCSATPRRIGARNSHRIAQRSRTNQNPSGNGVQEFYLRCPRQ